MTKPTDHHGPLRVLLISPLPRIDPPCGDITYTQNLLASPPEGVEYVTYHQALEEGTLHEHGVRRGIKQAMSSPTRALRVPFELAMTAQSRALNELRKRHFLFWEPFRYFSVRPGAFDLVHLHTFSARFLKIDCPLVVSNAIPVRYLYSDARRYSLRRTNALESIDIALARLLGVNLNSYYLPQCKRLVAFTDYLRDWYVERKIVREESIDVVPIYLPDSKPLPRKDKPYRIGFIAIEFGMKGGPTLLRAFETVRKARPDAELVVVGSEPRLSPADLERLGITWLRYVPREKLLSEIIPSLDVLAHPTEFDGLPLVVLEAMASGIPIASTRYRAMPEVLGNGSAGLLSREGDSAELAANLLSLLTPDTNHRMGAGARQLFERRYSDHAVRPLLRRSYERALGAA